MDLSALTLLKQSPNGQLDVSDKAQGLEGKEGGAEGFLQTLGEYLGKAETQEAALNDLGNEFSSSLTGNDLPVNEDVSSFEQLEVASELEGKQNEGLDIQPDADEDVGQSLSAFLSELPSDFKNNSLEGRRKPETSSEAFFDGPPINSRNNLLTGRSKLNNEQAALASAVREESELLKAAGDFLQEKGVKTESAINQFGSSALKSANLSHPEKEFFISTQSLLVSASEQTVSGKEQLQAMSKPLGHPDWGRELGDRISWMANKTIQVAELRLNPARLGPVEVHIKTSQEQASIMFISPHAAVREALEQALPRLRDMMSDQHFERVNVDVSQQSFDEKQTSDNHSNDSRESRLFAEIDGENEAVEAATTSSHVISGESLLSYYV
jgi:hypothetical protein